MFKQMLIEKLELVENLVHGSRLQRFLHSPWRYVAATVLMRNAVFKGIGRSVRKVDTFFGMPMHVVPFASSDIYMLGCKGHDSEVRLARYLIETLQEGDVVFDAGAHFGFFSLLASKLVGPTGLVVAIEASPANFEVLRRNAQDRINIVAMNVAAGKDNGTVTLFESDAGFHESNTIRSEFATEQISMGAVHFETKTIALRTLDNIASEIKRRPKLIKVDVEGAEDDVVRGLGELIELSSPQITIEYVLFESLLPFHREAANLLKANGYAPFAINSKGALYSVADIEDSMKSRNIVSDNIVFVRS